jgi:hypothetical protein
VHDGIGSNFGWVGPLWPPSPIILPSHFPYSNSALLFSSSWRLSINLNHSQGWWLSARSCIGRFPLHWGLWEPHYQFSRASKQLMPKYSSLTEELDHLSHQPTQPSHVPDLNKLWTTTGMPQLENSMCSWKQFKIELQ